MDNEQSSQDKQSSGKPRSASMIIRVWNKAGVVPYRDLDLWRTDDPGRLIRLANTRNMA